MRLLRDIVTYAENCKHFKFELMALIRLVCFLKQEVCCLKKKKTQHGCIISLTTSQRAKVPFKLSRLTKKEATQKVGEE